MSRNPIGESLATIVLKRFFGIQIFTPKVIIAIITLLLTALVAGGMVYTRYNSKMLNPTTNPPLKQQVRSALSR